MPAEPRRRRRGSGSVWLRPDGRWQSRIRLDGQLLDDYHETRELALAHLDTLLARRDHLAALARLGKDEALGAYLLRWLEAKRSTVYHTTWSSYSSVVRLSEPLWLIRLADLRVDLIRDFLAGLLSDDDDDDPPYTIGYVRTIRNVLKAALEDVVPDILASNPVKRVNLPRGDAPISAGQVYDEAEARRYLAALDGCPYALAMRLMLTIGLRQGEARAMRWSAIDWSARTVAISRSRQRNGREGPPKGRRPRTLDLPAGLVAALREAQSSQSPASLYVLSSPRPGLPPSGDTLRAHHRQACEAAGLREIRLHDLRHTCATLMLARQVPIAHVAQRLGHASPTITMRVYAHVLQSRQGQVAGVLDDLFFRAKPSDPQSESQSAAGNL